ncbi:MAG: homocysteine S-methyltransferase [Microbacterium sp.]|jgi:homocysteine S-methyltransferase|uniref:homocysteine S-methyltransferase n=1 Tax=Microbacterium sp. TaxID=51671 RepID=UPI002825B46D|nr:homocysteine S-methyltransferase [Microbacterium sp.]MDR2320058.1 homocysteine S-methyltransferase [Microbacterium sp.]
MTGTIMDAHADGTDPMPSVTILDGGLSTALEQQGIAVDGALWTARLLADEPERIAQAHRDFFEAGADVATTATYQASEQGFLAAGFEAAHARALIRRGVRLARDARDELESVRPGLRVAASVGPYGAVLGDGSEYRGGYGISAARLRDFHRARLELLAEAGPDLFAVETIPDVEEAAVLVGLLDEIGIPAWFSYSVRGTATCAGQPLADAYAALADSSVLIAAGVNCSDQADVRAAISTSVQVTGLPGVVYPNRGGHWDSATKAWSGVHAVDHALIEGWMDAGARYIGGCCGYGPADIAGLAKAVASVLR